MAAERRVLRWDVKVDSTVQEVGGGKVVHVGCRPDTWEAGPTRRLEVWTEESLPEGMLLADFHQLITRKVLVVGTAHPIPDGYAHIGSVIDPDPKVRLVWHIYEEGA